MVLAAGSQSARVVAANASRTACASSLVDGPPRSKASASPALLADAAVLSRHRQLLLSTDTSDADGHEDTSAKTRPRPGTLSHLATPSCESKHCVITPESDQWYDLQTSPQGWQAQKPQELCVTPVAKQSAGDNLTCKISTNSVRTALVDSVREPTSTMIGKHMSQTHSIASSPGGTYSTPLVPAVTTTPLGVT
jgi:hypothetical protein